MNNPYQQLILSNVFPINLLFLQQPQTDDYDGEDSEYNLQIDESQDPMDYCEGLL